MENEPKSLQNEVQQEAENVEPPTLAERFRDNFSLRFSSYLLLSFGEHAVLTTIGLDSFTAYRVTMGSLTVAMLAGESYAVIHWLSSRVSH